MIDGAEPVVTASWRTVAPLPLARRSIATALSPRVLALPTKIAPVFSTRVTPPELSMIAVATPSVPERFAPMEPLFLLVVTVAPASIAIPCAVLVAAPPPVAAIVP